MAREKFDTIPWHPLSNPLSRCTVALLSTAAIARKDDRPFDVQGEIDDPWWGDPSFRALPAQTSANDVELFHTHIDTRPAARDLNCVLPLDRLLEAQQQGIIGQVAATHYSIMGYILRPRVLLEETTPKIVEKLQREAVDAVALVPV